MNVMSSAEWYLPSDNKQGYGIGFDLDDLRLKYGDERVDAMTFDERVDALNLLAEAYAIKFIAKAGGMPREHAKEKLRELLNA